MFKATGALASRARPTCILAANPRQVSTSGSSKAWASRQTKDELQEERQVSSDQIREGRLADLKLWHSVETIKRLGHRMAQLDPLYLRRPEHLEQLDWSHPLVEQLRSRRDIVPTRGFLETKQPLMAVNELMEAVWSIYAGGQCGLEFEQVSCQEEREWLMRQWEQLNEMTHLNEMEQQNLAKLLLECETFDHFMGAKYPSTKRYGCEGAEPMLVVFDEILRLCHLGENETDDLTKAIGQIDDLIIGMPHRGRLNLLTCLLGMGPRVIFNKCRGEPELDLREAWMATGDVLSHLSLNTRFVYGLDRQHFGLWRDTPEPINVSLLPNPSHLEVSSPMVAGAARGRAHNKLHGYSSSPKFPPGLRASDETGDYSRFFPSILPIQVHGDASIAGQGIVQESLQMSQLPRFQVGGSIHLVINNQIGYTTESQEGRSSRQATDILKLIEAPIIHVNAENIGAIVRATRLALTYRQRFQKDVAIELVCYRQHGHNELDEPSFTQPLMYSAIRQRRSIPQQFCDQIGMSPERRQQIVDFYRAKLQAAHKSVDVFKPDNDNYRNFALPTEYHRDHISSWQSGCDLNLLREVGLATVQTPPQFQLHPTLKRVLQDERKVRLLEGQVVDSSKLSKVPVDWALAELLAFGSLLKQNQSVRLAGQDVARGTFSTRHAVLYDQFTGEPFVPLNHMEKTKAGQARAKLEVANTVLSEEAALAYEFAYSMETCALTCWEAQFGDFFNTAQSIVDTLVSSSESKWLRQSPLTMLLPHGLDGAGPEHSSSRLERFLQLSSSSQTSVDTEAKCNWSVCFPTQPSQYFHLLRRQVLRPFRKPLVVMAPKLIFRHSECVSPMSKFDLNSSFEPVLDDPEVVQRLQNSNLVSTLLLCSGKLYFQLHQLKLQEKLDNVAIVRIEELCPFPVQSIVHTIKQYPRVTPERIAWVQEEHKNQGAFNFVAERLNNMANLKLHYFGRQESEMPAPGSTSIHKRQMEQVIAQLHQWITNSNN